MKLLALAAGLCAALLVAGGAQAQTKTLKVGVLTDMSGLYVDLAPWHFNVFRLHSIIGP